MTTVIAGTAPPPPLAEPERRLESERQHESERRLESAQLESEQEQGPAQTPSSLSRSSRDKGQVITGGAAARGRHRSHHRR